MGLSPELVRCDLRHIFAESFSANARTRGCLSSSDPYLLGEDRFINYKLCLIASLAENHDLETGGALVFSKKTWRIVHMERARATLRLFLQEYKDTHHA
ncbi:hypothetical protein [Helicobacter salomonis]|uniref:hypothetical protein n=1 Tax=Helicobacter salomonis TaxID=56878 RepID=UPI000CF17515|nr:hypothetical protein [Helicobacter salomonis]